MVFDAINSATGQIVPEIILVATMCVMFLVGPFLVDEQQRRQNGLRHRWGTLSLAALVSAGFCWYWQAIDPAELGPFRSDEFVSLVRGLSLVFGCLLVLLSWNQVAPEHAAELHACLLAIIAGVNFVALSTDLVGVFLGLELVSISTYVFLYLPSRNRASREATLKYFLLSIFSSAIFLYGISWLFGAAGTTSLPGIIQAARGGDLDGSSSIVKLGTGLVMMGLAFRLAAVPFHFYAPDVFQGATSSAAAMLSFIPKLVGVVALLRLLPAVAGWDVLGYWSPTGSTQHLLAVLAVVTMFGGNLLALRQNDLFRLLACSSIAHAGYILVGLTFGNGALGVSGTSAVFFYLTAYGLMTIGVFALITASGSDEKPLRLVADLNGLARRKPAESLLLALCLFSMIGLPPTAGFLGKFSLFLSAWSTATWLGRALAFALAVNSVIAAWYYLRLLGAMYFGSTDSSPAPAGQPLPLIAGGACAVGTVVMFVLPQDIWNAVFASLR